MAVIIVLKAPVEICKYHLFHTHHNIIVVIVEKLEYNPSIILLKSYNVKLFCKTYMYWKNQSINQMNIILHVWNIS